LTIEAKKKFIITLAISTHIYQSSIGLAVTVISKSAMFSMKRYEGMLAKGTGTTQFDKLRLLFLVLSVIHFLREYVRHPSCNQPSLTMKKAPSGGDGTSSSPERAKVVESTTTEDTDCRFSKENPSGLEESQKSRTAANTARHARNPKNTSPGSVSQLPTVPERSKDKDKEDLEESESGMAETAEKRDGAGDDASLASGGETAAFSSFTMTQETTVSPCHQTMENSDMEMSSDEEEDNEIKTIIVSEASSRNKRFYQMKLSTYKSNATSMLIKVVKIMFSKEPRMEIELHVSMNKDFEAKPICSIDELPETEEETAAYFPSIYNNKNKDGTAIVFRLNSEQSHVDWRKTLQKEQRVQDLKLYIGVHKLSSTETQIIGFIDQKLPEATHINHYEELLKSKLSAAAPEFAIERIFPKTTSGFDVPVKTDVLGIRACKFEATEADMMMQKLLPPRTEGEYYVSFNGLDEETKRKAYKHQNWYAEKVKQIQVSGFNNIDCKYEIGLAQKWSFQEYMRQQPTSSKTIPIDVDNGGYKKKGTKILVLPQYTIAAKQVYEEFCDLTKRKTGNDYDMEMVDSDDATQVNANIRGHTDQLRAMFASDEFPEIETQVPLTDVRFETSDSDSSNSSKRKSKKQTSKKSKRQKSTKRQRIDRKQERENQDGTLPEASSKSQASAASSTSRASYSSVVSGTSRSAVPPRTSGNGKGIDLDMAELKEMMRALMQQNVEERKEANIA
jgi:hypothetical protein